MNSIELAVAVRAYMERPGEPPLAAKPLGNSLPASGYSLVFDCETSTDAAQSLRVGFAQVRKGSRLHSEALFFDPDNLTPTEIDFLQDYAERHGLEVITVEQFRKDWFLKYGYRLGGMVVGFNLPFDISRIAIAHSPARGRAMRGGFSFLLSQYPDQPRVRVKHLSPRAALIDFSIPGKEHTGRGMRNRGFRVPKNRGHFLDIKTLASALLSQRFSLGSLASALGTATQKRETDEHGRLTDTYLDYARADVQVTWECFSKLLERYEQHGLSKDPDRILSEATIGKAYLQEMGVKPFLGCNPDFPRNEFGRIMCAYYGGRAEVHIRRKICEIIYCDFKSMYPTVNALMGLWKFVIAEGLHHAETTTETQRFLDRIESNNLQNPETWTQLTTLVELMPGEDLLPVRAKYNGTTNTIGLNHLSCNNSLWYTLADCVASKLLSGKTPRIRKAITYTPGAPQSDLKPIRIMGREEYEIDPLVDDLFRRLVDSRDDAKAQKDDIEKALKILVNSTSYGIFIEINRDDAPKAEELTVIAPSGESHLENFKAIEQPGRFFHPLLGVLITGAARLMLALAERKTLDFGLDWAFCDTDSLAITRPEALPRSEFRKRANAVVNWFKPLNPYRKAGSILQIEDINYGIDSSELKPLYCFAISAKRYALFNLDEKNRPVLRKASAHGLGHLIDPYTEKEAPITLPTPQVPLSEIGVRRWQHDLWVQIIQAALRGQPDQVPLDWHPSLLQPAPMRYTASSPEMLRWLDPWNDGKAYAEIVKPFGFLLNFTARTGIFAAPPNPEASVVTVSGRGRPPKAADVKPISPYEARPAEALSQVFDRISGDVVCADSLKTYAEVLCQYHLSPESKFANANFLDRGSTERRHITADAIELIGKEANRIGKSGEVDPITSAVSCFGSSSI